MADRIDSTRAARWVGWAAALGLLLMSVSEGVLNPALVSRPIASLLAFSSGFLWLFLPLTGRPTRRALTRAVFGSRRLAFNLVLWLATTVLAAVVSWLLFQGLPHLDDSVSALFQAKIFASGRLTIPLPDGGEFFSLTCNIDARHHLGHMCSMYPPGHPALLLPGLLLGVPWLVTPMFGGALAVGTHELARRIYGRRVGRMAGLIAASSPFVVMLAGTHLSHLPTAFFLVCSMWSIWRLRQTSSWGFGLAAGAFFAAAVLIRPLTAVAAGAVIAVGSLGRPKAMLWRWKGLVAGLLTALLAVGLMAAWQQETTGDWRTPGHSVSLGDHGRLGFRASQSFTPRVGWNYTRMRLETLNHRVLGWPVPLFLVALLPFLLLRGRWEDVWMLLVPLALLGLFWFYYYLEFFFPARYIFSGVPMLILLAARGYAVAAGWARSSPSASIRRLPVALLAGCVTFMLLVYSPVYFASIPANHGDVESRLAQVVDEADLDAALVFVEGVAQLPRGSNNDLGNDFYATGFLRNDIDFAGDVVYARSYEGHNHRLAGLYPARSYYLYRYNRAEDRGRLFELELEGAKEILVPLKVRRRR